MANVCRSRNIVEDGNDAGEYDRGEGQEVEIQRHVEDSLYFINRVATSIPAAPIRKFDS